ncbi:hypothetical protein [Hyphomicrobium sp. DY-1]|uniref:hypothetical protein n=1 Tax=Hyphomicrobium sp. DY-1 TaxID=3075650 RepID=UPI0039C29325
MPAPEPILGYPSKTAAVRDLFDNKKMKRREIAELLDIEISTVSSLIFYSKNGKRQDPARADDRMMQMPGDLFALAKSDAERRRITPHELFRRIVRAVIEEGIVDAVLDDAEEYRQ